MMTKILLLLLIALFPFCAPQPTSADLLTSADVPLVPKPDTEAVAFGLQAIRVNTTQEVPITVLDVIAGQRQLSRFSPTDQTFVRNQFQKYAASPSHSTDEAVLKSTAKADLRGHDPYAQEPRVSFILNPYIEISPSAPTVQKEKNAIVAYGQPVNANNLAFAEFLRSLSPVQRNRPLTVSDLSLKQRLFVSGLWQTSPYPECVKLCSMPETHVTIGFYLAAVVTQTYSSGSVTYHLQMPQPADGQDFLFDSASGQHDRGWARF